MRYHAKFPGVLCEGVAEADAQALRLVAVRYEAMRSIDGAIDLVDLTFFSGERVVVIGGVQLDRHALAYGDRLPFVAPLEAEPYARALEEAYPRAAAILVDALLRDPHLREALHLADPAAAAALAARRSADELGAAPYHRVAAGRGRAVGPSASIESCVFGEIPHTGTVRATSFGDRNAATKRCIMLSDESLRTRGVAYHLALGFAQAFADGGDSVDLCGYDERSLAGYASLYAVGLDDPEPVVDALAQARREGVAANLVPLFDDPVGGGFWGARAHLRIARIAGDEEAHRGYGRTLAARALVLEDGVRAGAPYEPRRGYVDAQRTALLSADRVFVLSGGEAERIAAFTTQSLRFAPLVIYPGAVPHTDPASAPYVLCTSPVAPLHNTLTVARAATRARVPVRFCGAVADRAYAARTWSYLDPLSRLTPLDPGDGARAVVDLAWSGVDVVLLASFAAAGIPVVVSSRSDARDLFGTAGVFAVDPGDEAAIARVLRDAFTSFATDPAARRALAAHIGSRHRPDVLTACLERAERELVAR